MPFRSKRRFTGRPMRKRGVWINIPFGGVNFSETVGRQLLLLPEDWEASFTGLTNEHASLRCIVGQLNFIQITAGTAGGNFFWGIYAAGIDKAAPVFTTTGMSDVSWLTTGVRATSSVVTNTLVMGGDDYVSKVNVKAKRKLDTNTQLAIVAQYGSDAASPAGIMSGLLRFFVVRD